VSDVTVYITIGNSDDKLSQVEWSRFIGDVQRAIGTWGGHVYGDWFSRPDCPFQNACFGASFSHDNIGGLRMNLKQVRELYRQDSIAFAVVYYTEMI
jgi:hypothetical protein